VVTLTVLPADLGAGVRAGFTTRAGGVSAAEYAGLDLALHVGDDPAAVGANRQRLAAWAGAPVRFARQVHGTRVAVAAGPGSDLDDAGAAGEPEADALVSAAPGVPVAVLVADCLPVLLADAEAGVVGAAHAGRRGLLAGVLPRTVEAMAALGADPARLRVAVGPAAGACCYEVPQDLHDEAVGVLPQLTGTTTWGTPSLDLRGAAVAQLRSLGVAGVTTVGGCTVEDATLYSYRRSRTTGRFAGVVAVR
jgi:hypothetical protein